MQPIFCGIDAITDKYKTYTYTYTVPVTYDTQGSVLSGQEILGFGCLYTLDAVDLLIKFPRKFQIVPHEQL